MSDNFPLAVSEFLECSLHVQENYQCDDSFSLELSKVWSVCYMDMKTKHVTAFPWRWVNSGVSVAWTRKLTL